MVENDNQKEIIVVSQEGKTWSPERQNFVVTRHMSADVVTDILNKYETPLCKKTKNK